MLVLSVLLNGMLPRMHMRMRPEQDSLLAVLHRMLLRRVYLLHLRRGLLLSRVLCDTRQVQPRLVLRL